MYLIQSVLKPEVRMTCGEWNDSAVFRSRAINSVIAHFVLNFTLLMNSSPVVEFAL